MTRDEAEECAIRAVGFEHVDDVRRTVSILGSLGLIKLRDRALDEPVREAIAEVLDEAAERLETFSTNKIYHKALLRGAKILREMKREYEIRELSARR